MALFAIWVGLEAESVVEDTKVAQVMKKDRPHAADGKSDRPLPSLETGPQSIFVINIISKCNFDGQVVQSSSSHVCKQRNEHF